MALYLVQHGISHKKDVDPEQGLTQEGEEKVRLIGGVARDYKVKVSAVWHSGKKRARQTAEIFASYLGAENGVVEVQGLKPLDDVRGIAAKVNLSDNIMIAGHQPFMQKLISYIITGNEEPVVFKVQNGGIVCIDVDPDTGNPVITWALMPTIS